MTQIVPLSIVLGPVHTGLAIGYSVLNLDRKVYSAFTTTNVAESNVHGTYYVIGGVVAPLNGGYIVCGTASTDMVETTVESSSANVTMQAGVAVAPADANGNVPANVIAWRDEDVQPSSMPGIPDINLAYVDTFAGGMQSIRNAMKLAPTAGDPAGGSVDAQLAAILANTNALAAIGIYSYSDTVTDPSDNPLDGVLVLLATDDTFGTVVSFARTNAAGQFTVRSDTPGTHYLRLQLAPYSFEDQTIELT